MIEGVFYEGGRSRGIRAQLELGLPGLVRVRLVDEVDVERRPREWQMLLSEVEISERIGKPRGSTGPSRG